MMTEETFRIEYPHILWMVWLLPVIAAGFWAAWRMDRKAFARYFSPEIAADLSASVCRTRRRIKLSLLMASIFFFIVALAEPKWGVSEQTVFTRGRDIVILLDVSKSMMATDVAPSRLERVKLDIQDMVGALRGDRVALVAFAGMPVLRCPLTTDYGFFMHALDRSGPQSVGRGGTFLGDAIRLGLDVFTDRAPNHKVMVLISDGEDQGSYPIEAARIAATRGVRIYTIGVGDPDIGSQIQYNGEVVTDEGRPVWSKLNPEDLKKIALESGGAYIPAGTRSVDLDRIYRQKISKVEEKEMEETKKKYVESRYQVFLLIGLVLLIVEILISDRRSTRRTITP